MNSKIQFYKSFLEFPEKGLENVLYINTDDKQAYIWNEESNKYNSTSISIA